MSNTAESKKEPNGEEVAKTRITDRNEKNTSSLYNYQFSNNMHASRGEIVFQKGLQ